MRDIHAHLRYDLSRNGKTIFTLLSKWMKTNARSNLAPTNETTVAVREIQLKKTLHEVMKRFIDEGMMNMILSSSVDSA